MQDKRYDVAIVGAGFSGPILAAKIAQSGVNPRNGERLKVALIEAGPYIRGRGRAGYGTPARRRAFTNLADGWRGFTWPESAVAARLVGGSSVHWDGQAFLPFPADFRHWETETGLDWSEANMRDAVAEIRREFNIHPFPDAIDTQGNRLFQDVARRMGYDPKRQEGARRNCIYCGFCVSPTMCKYDSRASTLVTYIPVAEDHGVDILPDTVVEKILIDARAGRGIARGFACSSGGSRFQILADKVIVSCGYSNTPLMLMRSGYGPRTWKGNPILVENKNIGQHIDGHPNVPGVSAIFDQPLGDGEWGSVGGYFMIHDERQDAEGRLLFRATFGSAYRWPADAALNPLAPLYGREHKQFMHDKGVLRTGSLSPSVSKASGRWYINEEGRMLYGGDHALTVRRAKEGMAISRSILEKMGARRITSTQIPVELTPQTSGSHRVGSCRAGADPRESVVNAHFESHDVDNLLLCDASVIPRVTTGNSGTPQASVTVFAAGRMIERHFKR